MLLKQLKVGDFFFYRKHLYIKTQLWWDNNPGMDYGVIEFSLKRGKIVRNGLWMDSTAEVSPTDFVDEMITNAILSREKKRC